MKTVYLGDMNGKNGFNINIDEIVSVRTPAVERDSSNDLVVKIQVYTKSIDDPFSYSSVLKEADYEVITVPFMGFFKRTEKKLIKYSPDEYNESKEYIEAWDMYNAIISKINE
jgi:hypothetical protein